MEIPLRRVAGSRDCEKENKHGRSSGHYTSKGINNKTDPDSNKFKPSSPMDWQILSRMLNSFSDYQIIINWYFYTSNNIRSSCFIEVWNSGLNFSHNPASEQFSFCLIKILAKFRKVEWDDERSIYTSITIEYQFYIYHRREVQFRLVLHFHELLLCSRS